MPAPTLNFVAATDTGLSMTFVNADGAGANFFVEVNRAADFASDDTIFYQISAAAAGTNAFTITGLPSGTPWYVRISSLASSTTSNTLLLATGPVMPNLYYPGFSIDQATLIVPEDIVGLDASTPSIAGYPFANLLDEGPATTARTDAQSFSLNFTTAGVAVDTFALLGTLFNDEATWSIQAYSDPARTTGQILIQTGDMPFRCSKTIGRRPYYHGMYRFASPMPYRFWRIDIVHTGKQAIMRNLVAGLSRRSVNPSRGWGQATNDQGTSSRTRFGDLDTVTGWRGRTVDFEMSWLSEAEYQTKWSDLPVRVGKTKSVLAFPNSKRNVHLNDRLAWGPITEWRGENVQSSRFTQSVAIDSAY
jgi:hypothetical protein